MCWRYVFTQRPETMPPACNPDRRCPPGTWGKLPGWVAGASSAAQWLLPPLTFKTIGSDAVCACMTPAARLSKYQTGPNFCYECGYMESSPHVVPRGDSRITKPNPARGTTCKVSSCLRHSGCPGMILILHCHHRLPDHKCPA